MISSIVSRLVILVFGTLYPAYASYKAVRTRNVKEYVKWMMYWIVFALFTCAETFTDVFLSFWFPFYYEIKIILVVWLLSPATKGSSILYRRFVHPALIRREAEIDDALARATEQGYTAVLHFGTKGVNYATTVLMQTAIKGGGGLVQQLKKSYSLSDLTGEKEDENRNTTNSRDETDMQVEPRRREQPGRRGYSPRRTQSSSNRVEMYFSEVDVDVRQPRTSEPIVNLSNIRSSEDISSGYSSGEALHSHKPTTQVDSLIRTSSVGARVRAKPRATTKKVPEEDGEDSDCVDFDSSESTQFPSPLNFLTSEQALELLMLLSQRNCQESTQLDRSREDQVINAENETFVNKSIIVTVTKSNQPESHDEISKNSNVESDSPDNCENYLGASISEVESGQTEKNILVDNLDIVSEDDCSLSGEHLKTPAGSFDIDTRLLTDEICQKKIEELKEILTNARQAASNIVSSQELRESDISEGLAMSDLSRSNSDSSTRAGKYHKKPAPKVPSTSRNEEESIGENALKATLVIKTGTIKTFSTIDSTKDVFLSPPETKKKTLTRSKKDGFSKLLTIPKNIFHSAFHKDQPDIKDSSSSLESSVASTSTAEWTENVENSQEESGIEIALQAAMNDNSEEGDFLRRTDDKSSVGDQNHEDSETKSKLRIRQMSKSPSRGGGKSMNIC
ncbi:uncharacterized protein [Prorops nasuta]|uniref:uncharacterized protein isoform X2 n=1 Tax=Prorops nasuta TaxID=863751 RepID=UPI0034CEA42B